MKGFFLFAAFSCISATAVAQVSSPWIKVSEAETGAKSFIRLDDFARGSGAHDVWVKTDLSKDRTTRYRSTMTLYRINCSNRAIGALQLTKYFPDGRNESSGPFSYPSMAISVPGTTGESMVSFVCFETSNEDVEYLDEYDDSTENALDASTRAVDRAAAAILSGSK